VVESLQALGVVNVTFDFVEKGIQTWTAKDHYEENSSIQ
jgi:hypothetical protein